MVFKQLYNKPTLTPGRLIRKFHTFIPNTNQMFLNY